MSIRAIGYDDIPECVEVIKAGFMTVAKQFDITPENAPAFTAYATDEAKIRYWMDEQKRPMYGFYEDGKLLGYYNLMSRHKGIGEELLNDSIKRARELGCKIMKLSIVEENKVLRKWYESFGFIHTGTVKYDFFPFTCGYLEKNI